MAHIAPEQRQPGERLVRIGAVVFTVGLLAAVLVVVPFFFGRSNASLPLTLGTLLMPAGLGLALSGLLRGARRARH
jgi:lipopolysaccharide export LptBFGC system permease protein LptF